MLFRQFLGFLVSTFILHTKVYADRLAGNNIDESNDHEPRNRQCGLYYAPSSIEGAGYGIFSGRKLRPQSIVGGSSIAILLTDLNRYNNFQNPPIIHYDYFWMPDWANQWYEASYAESFVPGLGALSNYHPYLHNIKPRVSRLNDFLFDRFIDEGSGAVSYYDTDFVATKFISAGDEIFANYGENWVHKRLESGKIDVFPLGKNYEQANSIIHKVSSLLEIIGYDHSDDVISTIKNIVEDVDKSTGVLLPIDQNETQILLNEGIATLTLQPRGMEYLEKHGLCLDDIRLRRSTVAQAGRGVFAERSFHAEERIAPLPLLHIADKSKMNMFHWHENDEGIIEVTDEKMHDQLYLNYCFGDKRSSVLLCGTTTAIMVNHRSSSSLENVCNDGSFSEENRPSTLDGPNAYLRWADWDESNKEWLNLSYDELLNKHGRGMSMELVALRDIKIGEEIFINYGNDWEKAWNIHVQSWQAPSGPWADYERVSLKNSAGAFKTREELGENSYASNLLTVCLYWEIEEHYEFPETYETSSDWVTWSDDEIIDTFSISGDAFVRGSANEFDETWWPCEVYRRSENSDVMTVRIYQSLHEDETNWQRRSLPRFVTNLSKRSIHFVNRMETSDQHLPNAFRHPIGLPDGIFPEQWFNLIETEV